MASTGIQIVNISNLEKIENFLNDSAYREVIENSENYNTRLCIERRLRMPFLDPQTSVAQNHCALFMKRKQRMPGFREGQIYTYPAARWRKSRRQYLIQQNRPFGMLRDTDVDSLGLDGSSIGAGDTDSKDSQNVRECEGPKDWYYDEMDIHEMDAFHDPEPDSDYDYEDHYSIRKKRKRTPARGRGPSSLIETPTKRGRGGTTRGRRKTAPLFDPDSPHSSGSTPVSNRGGRGRMSGSSSSSSHFPPPTTVGSSANTSVGGSSPHPIHPPMNLIDEQQQQQQQQQTILPVLLPEQQQKLIPDEPRGEQLQQQQQQEHRPKLNEKGKALPSPYCDFCLGDARENKKTRIPEELVSCSDCGRSGHPTCLQFTPNMMISVKRYRWQCIECKYCSICGTSDNDDQLLFCDDCDRGYHMYCLSPPLTVPPEGSWSCKLCQEEFHNKK